MTTILASNYGLACRQRKSDEGLKAYPMHQIKYDAELLEKLKQQSIFHYFDQSERETDPTWLVNDGILLEDLKQVESVKVCRRTSLPTQTILKGQEHQSLSMMDKILRRTASTSHLAKMRWKNAVHHPWNLDIDKANDSKEFKKEQSEMLLESTEEYPSEEINEYDRQIKNVEQKISSKVSSELNPSIDFIDGDKTFLTNDTDIDRTITKKIENSTPQTLSNSRIYLRPMDDRFENINIETGNKLYSCTDHKDNSTRRSLIESNPNFFVLETPNMELIKTKIAQSQPQKQMRQKQHGPLLTLDSGYYSQEPSESFSASSFQKSLSLQFSRDLGCPSLLCLMHESETESSLSDSIPNQITKEASGSKDVAEDMPRLVGRKTICNQNILEEKNYSYHQEEVTSFKKQNSSLSAEQPRFCRPPSIRRKEAIISLSIQSETYLQGSDSMNTQGSSTKTTALSLEPIITGKETLAPTNSINPSKSLTGLKPMARFVTSLTPIPCSPTQRRREIEQEVAESLQLKSLENEIHPSKRISAMEDKNEKLLYRKRQKEFENKMALPEASEVAYSSRRNECLTRLEIHLSYFI
ncbi:unnamed protein product [Protopolystoma xenopodis]|uniref:Uncharacterized protein n=1 Tax=Protopolystoma xenopodis TaxID=117903 RepID=A0A448WV76_9PLAT|nr:unnamed protein product [Protopolystoma xenopodis]